MYRSIIDNLKTMEPDRFTMKRCLTRRARFRISCLLLLAAVSLPACNSSTTKSRTQVRSQKPHDFRPHSVQDLKNPYFIRHKLQQILWDCDESMFLGDRLLEEDVVKFMGSYTRCKSRKSTNRTFRRGSSYTRFIRQDFAQFDLCRHVAWGLPYVESHFRPEARSRAGAMGMFQFMPMTAREFGLRDPLDWRASSQVSALYLATLRKVFGKSIVLAMAAYNGGQQRIFNAIYASSKRAPHAKDFLFSDIYKHLPMETRQYPGRILAAGLLHESLQDLGVDTLPEECVQSP